MIRMFSIRKQELFVDVEYEKMQYQLPRTRTRAVVVIAIVVVVAVVKQQQQLELPKKDHKSFFRCPHTLFLLRESSSKEQ